MSLGFLCAIGSTQLAAAIAATAPNSRIYSLVYESAYDVTDKRLNCATRIQFVRLLSTVFMAKERLFSLFILFFCALSLVFRQNVLWSSENCQVSENEMLSQPIAWCAHPPAISLLFMLDSPSHAHTHLARARERERERINTVSHVQISLWLMYFFIFCNVFIVFVRSFLSFRIHIRFPCFAGGSVVSISLIRMWFSAS